MAQDGPGDQYRAGQWFAGTFGLDRMSFEVLGLIPNEEVHAWNEEHYPDRNPGLDLTWLMDGADPLPTPEPDPRPRSGPE